MKFKYGYLTYLLLFLFINCDKKEKLPVFAKKDIKRSTLFAKENWQFLDIQNDTIPGISLDKAFQQILKNKNGNEIVVAVLDTEIDINHRDLKGNIWFNSKETLNNIDDDGNGYIDDISGWNFLGNKEGANVFYQQYEMTRITKRLATHPNVLIKDSTTVEYKLFLKAQESLNKEMKKTIRILKVAPDIQANYRKELKNFFLPKDEEITIQLLDSLIQDKIISKNEVKTLYRFKKVGLTLKRLEADSVKYQLKKDIYLNLDYNDKSVTKDNPHNFEDTIYGNNILNGNTKELYHGTKVSGSIIGLNNILESNNNPNQGFLKIMPVCIASNGDEHDKDIYTAIKYAVNQGAKVINLSTGKEYSLYSNKVQEAMKYAEEKDVLIITSAGNNSLNLDDENINYYPQDTGEKGKEIIGNVIRVGASGSHLNKTLKAFFSNYGKESVDVFAPGIDIYTTSATSESGYEITRGTSHAAPIASRIVALIRSYYPSLTASEVKQILMDSSVKYDILVDVPTKENPEQQLPFNELSKSGGIVNAYNAMLMAEEYVKTKKK